MARSNKRGGPSSGGPLRVIGYCRVSTEEQRESGAGLAAQRAAIVEAAERRGFELVDVVKDTGSGKSMAARPNIESALRRIEAHEADGLVVSKLDRLSRSLVDFAGIMERAQRKGWALIALDLGIDTTSPAGELVASVMASVAQWERRAIASRTREALAAKKAAGVRIGRPTALAPNIIERIVTDFQTGANRSEIARRLNDESVPTAHGGSRWYPSTVRQVLVSAGMIAD